MPTPRNIFLLALAALAAISTAQAQRPSAKPQEVFAPYWTSEPGWDTELQLKNNLSSGSLTVTPVLRLANGEEIPLDPVTIASNASISVQVNEALLQHSATLINQPGSYGSVLFRFTSFHAMNLYATVVPSIRGVPIAFPIRAYAAWQRESSLDRNRPGSLEGIWWQPRSGLKDVLVIGNSSEKKISGILSLFDAAGKRWSEPLSLAPYQTLRFAPSDLAQKAGLGGSYGGITFDVPAAAQALDAAHFMYDEAAQYSVSLEMFSRDPHTTVRERTGTDGKLWTMRAPMLALSSPDPAAGFPAGTVLQPLIFLRNATARPISADLALNWHSDSASGQVQLPKVDLDAFATRQLQLGLMQRQLGIPEDAHWALVTLTTTAQPDGLIAIASSRDVTGRYHIETNFSGAIARQFTGAWLADATHTQILSVTNSGQKPVKSLLSLHYDNGRKTYQLRQQISPAGQAWVNLGILIHDRVPDDNGTSLPVDLTSGTYDVKDLTSTYGSLTVNALAFDQTLGNRVGVPQPDCCAQGDPDLSPSQIEISVDGFTTVAGTATNTCNGAIESIMDQLTYWSAVNPVIAQVTTGKVTGLSPGLTAANASGTVAICYGNTLHWENLNLSDPVTVTAIPVNFQLTSAQNGGEGVLGIIRSFSWQSSDGNLNDLSSCSMRENVTYPANNNSICPNNSPPQQCYYPPSPPWAGSGAQDAYPNPTLPPSQPATGGTSVDTNAVYNLNFVKPYAANSFNATQYVQYSCNAGSWTNLYGPVTITRSVSKSGSQWIATISASDTSVTSTYVLP